MTYFDALDRQQQANLSALWHRFLATGVIRPYERLEQLECGLLMFRTSLHRLVGFTDRRDVILIDAFSRRDFPGTRPKERLEESRRLQQEHLALQGETDALPA